MRTYFVDNLPEPIRTEVIKNFEIRLYEANGDVPYLKELIELETEALLDSKVIDIEDSIDSELYDRVLKIAGWL